MRFGMSFLMGFFFMGRMARMLIMATFMMPGFGICGLPWRPFLVTFHLVLKSIYRIAVRQVTGGVSRPGPPVFLQAVFALAQGYAFDRKTRWNGVDGRLGQDFVRR